MIKIITKVKPATNLLPCRLIATAPDCDSRKRVIIAYDYGMTAWHNHVAAAETYRREFAEDFANPINRVGTLQFTQNSWASIYE